jgi:hypothetical protein
MVCTFYHGGLNICTNPYCYYELFNEPSCPIKQKYMLEIGAVDPAYKVRLQEAARKEREKEQAKSVIWGKK